MNEPGPGMPQPDRHPAGRRTATRAGVAGYRRTARPVRGLLLYDADCGICTRAAAFVPRLGMHVSVRPLQHVDLAALGVSSSRAEHEIPYVTPTGKVAYGHLAIAHLLDTAALPLRIVGRVMRIWPVSTICRWMYQGIAANRSRLPGSSPSCERPAQAP